MAKSAGGHKEKLEWILKQTGVEYECEFSFHPKRKWRFDYVFPTRMVAIEYEGLFSQKSRHTTVKGYSEDCQKYNEAALLGYTLLRFTAKEVESGHALDAINRAMSLTRSKPELSEIGDAASKASGVPLQCTHLKKRKPERVMLRRLIAGLAHKRYFYSFTQIARYLGCHHSTIVTYLANYDYELKTEMGEYEAEAIRLLNSGV